MGEEEEARIAVIELKLTFCTWVLSVQSIAIIVLLMAHLDALKTLLRF